MGLLAFIESPLQALNLLEYASRYSHVVDIAVVADRGELGETNRSQIEAVLDLVGPRHTIYHESRSWPHKPGRSRAQLASAADAIRKLASEAPYQCVLGEYRSAFYWALARELRLLISSTVVLDDGTAMLRIRRRQRLPRSRDQWRSLLKTAMFAAAGLRTAPPKSPLTFFSSFAIAELVAKQDIVIHNDYRTLRGELQSLPADLDSVYVIGSPHLEAGVMNGGDVELALMLARRAAESTGKNVLYMAHRRERSEKLDAIRSEFVVVRPSVPFELYPRIVGKKPSVVYGYQSTLFATLAELIGPSLEIVSIVLGHEHVNETWWAFVDNLYDYYRNELQDSIRVEELKTYPAADRTNEHR